MQSRLAIASFVAGIAFVSLEIGLAMSEIRSTVIGYVLILLAGFLLALSSLIAVRGLEFRLIHLTIDESIRERVVHYLAQPRHTDTVLVLCVLLLSPAVTVATVLSDSLIVAHYWLIFLIAESVIALLREIVLPWVGRSLERQ